MSILRYNRQPVKAKPTRKTPRPSAPFACGLTTHSEQDEAWWLAQLQERDIPDSEYDARAAESEWYHRYEQGLTGDGRCALCGRITDDLTGGLCDGCALSLDREGTEEDPEGGVCPVCRCWSDYVEQDTGLCPVCDLAASEMSNGSNRGY